MGKRIDTFDSPLVIALKRGAGPGELDTHISRLPSDDFRSASEIVFRVDGDFITSISEHSAIVARVAAIRRAGNKPIYLLTYIHDKRRFALFNLNSNAPDSFDDEEVIDILRSKDLASTLQGAQDTCCFRATDGFHFVLPSGAHTDLFIRVADVCRSVEGLDQLAFWLLPSLASCDAVLIDSWSILSVVLRAQQLLGKKVPFNCLSQHPEDDRLSVRTAFERLISEVTSERPRIFCLVSITGSGKLVRTFEDLPQHFGEHLGLSVDVKSIYAFMDCPENVPVMCRLPYKALHFESKLACSLCAGTSVPVGVDSQLYYVKSAQETDTILAPASFVEPRQFLDAYGSVPELLSVHRDDPNDKRHHAFEVDVAKLLDHLPFTTKLETMLRKLPVAPEIVVVPPHRAGRVMGMLASKMFGARYIEHDDLRSSNGMNVDDYSALQTAGNVLVMDDVVNSGSRLSAFNRALREEYRQFKSISYIVGLARPASKQSWETIRISLTKNHPWISSLQAVETLFLPSWGSNLCPWCHEYDFLSGVSELLPLPPEWLLSRIDVLAGRDRGISEEPLFMLPGAQSQSLGHGSPVGAPGSSSLIVIFTLASALESLRQHPDETRRLWPRFPVSRIFAHKNLENYTEGLLRAALLRLLRPYEWGALRRDHLTPQVAGYCAASDQTILMGEALLAHFQRSIHFSEDVFTTIYGTTLLDLTRSIWKQ